MLLHGQLGQGEDRAHPLAGEGRGEQHRGPVEEIELGAQLLFHGGEGVAVLLDHIPFVHHHHAGAAFLLDPPRQALVLLGDPIEGINHEHADVGAFDRLETAIDTEVLRPVIHTAAATDAGRVEQLPGEALPLDGGVDRVAGGAADRAHDRPVLATDGIEQAGFAHIGPADDRQLDRRLALLLRGGRQEADHAVEQVAGAGAMDGRDRVGLAQPQAPKFRRHREALVGGFTLIHRQQHRHPLAPKPFGDRLVCRHQPLLAIHDHHRHGRFSQGEVGLLADLRQKFAVVVEHQTAGVDHPERAVGPEAFLVGTVAGDTWLVVHNRLAALAEAVDQGGLAHVRAPNNGDHRQRHGLIPFNRSYPRPYRALGRVHPTWDLPKRSATAPPDVRQEKAAAARFCDGRTDHQPADRPFRAEALRGQPPAPRGVPMPVSSVLSNYASVTMRGLDDVTPGVP